jgi:hypothetical protein
MIYVELASGKLVFAQDLLALNKYWAELTKTESIAWLLRREKSE